MHTSTDSSMPYRLHMQGALKYIERIAVIKEVNPSLHPSHFLFNSSTEVLIN